MPRGVTNAICRYAIYLRCGPLVEKRAERNFAGASSVARFPTETPSMSAPACDLELKVREVVKLDTAG